MCIVQMKKGQIISYIELKNLTDTKQKNLTTAVTSNAKELTKAVSSIEKYLHDLVHPFIYTHEYLCLSAG